MRTSALLARAALIAGCLALPALAAPSAAQADDAVDKATAEAAFREGVALLDKGDAAAACPKLEAAVALTKGEALGGKLLLGRCYEKLGRVASAWGVYLEVAARATAAGQADRATEARTAADAVAPRVPKISLVIAPTVASTEGLALTRDGKPVPREAWATALPVDPGQVVLALSAPGKRATTTLQVPEGATLEARFDALESTGEVAPPAAPAVPPPAAPPPAVPPPTAPPASDDTGDGQRIAGLVIGGAGIAAFAAGGILGLLAKSDYDTAYEDGQCAEVGDGIECDSIDGIDDARGTGTVATIVGGVGLGVLAAGVIVFLTAPSAPDAAAAGIAPTLVVGEHGAFVGLEGRF